MKFPKMDEDFFDRNHPEELKEMSHDSADDSSHGSAACSWELSANRFSISP
jgi:hypothetical protein